MLSYLIKNFFKNQKSVDTQNQNINIGTNNTINTIHNSIEITQPQNTNTWIVQKKAAQEIFNGIKFFLSENIESVKSFNTEKDQKKIIKEYKNSLNNKIKKNLPDLNNVDQQAIDNVLTELFKVETIQELENLKKNDIVNNMSLILSKYGIETKIAKQ